MLLTCRTTGCIRTPTRLVTFIDLHDLPRFLNHPGTTFDTLGRVFTFLLTARGIPMIYYGDEIGMTGGNDPDNRRDFPGGWKEDARNAFEASDRSAEQEKLRAHLQRLTKLRAGSAALRRGQMVDLLVEDHAYAFARVPAEERVLVVFNDADEAATLHVPVAGSGVTDGTTLADSLSDAHAQVRNGSIEISLAGYSVAIFK